MDRRAPSAERVVAELAPVVLYAIRELARATGRSPLDAVADVFDDAGVARDALLDALVALLDEGTIDIDPEGDISPSAQTES
jgi:hypothetical protein